MRGGRDVRTSIALIIIFVTRYQLLARKRFTVKKRDEKLYEISIGRALCAYTYHDGYNGCPGSSTTGGRTPIHDGYLAWRTRPYGRKASHRRHTRQRLYTY